MEEVVLVGLDLGPIAEEGLAEAVQSHTTVQGEWGFQTDTDHLVVLHQGMELVACLNRL